MKYNYEIFILAGLFVTASSCSLNLGGTKKGIEICDNSESERTFFRDTVYAVARSKCASCHATGGIPQFANMDRTTAYKAAQPLMIGTPSKLELYSGNEHCGIECNDSTPMKISIKVFQEALLAIPPCTGDPLVSPTTSPATSATVTPSPTTTSIVALGQIIYDQKCADCHGLGAYDMTLTNGAPDLQGHALDVDGQFANDKNHKGNTLSATEITNIKAFIVTK